MGHRLSKIYTRTGDTGTTGLGDGSRIAKTSLRVGAFGDIDELNSVIGLCLASPDLPEKLHTVLLRIQNDLFDLGGELCMPGYEILNQEYITRLENTLDELNEDLEPLKDFILPGGSQAGAAIHMARTICRRAERQLWLLDENEPVSDFAKQYLNRLSDMLFVMARWALKQQGVGEVLWQKSNQPTKTASADTA